MAVIAPCSVFSTRRWIGASPSLLIETHLLQPQATYLLVGDEVVVTKAGHETHGLDRFFSSLFGKPVPGLAFFAFALVNVQQRTAQPLRIGQVLRPEPVAVPVTPAPAAPVEKRGCGRPKGSKNRNKADVALAPYLSFILTLLQAVKQVLGTTLTVTYVVLDGAFGNNYALQNGPALPIRLDFQTGGQFGVVLPVRWYLQRPRPTQKVRRTRQIRRTFA